MRVISYVGHYSLTLGRDKKITDTLNPETKRYLEAYLETPLTRT